MTEHSHHWVQQDGRRPRFACDCGAVRGQGADKFRAGPAVPPEVSGVRLRARATVSYYLWFGLVAQIVGVCLATVGWNHRLAVVVGVLLVNCGILAVLVAVIAHGTRLGTEAAEH